MAEEKTKTTTLTEEEKKKLISLPILTSYDEKLKNWVVKRISNMEGVGGLTEEELKALIKQEVETQNELIII